MSFRVYNTLTNKKEEFVPVEKGKIKMYTCGPTVYDYASIGNMWSYLTADILRRYLEYLGYEVRQIKNITDVGHFTDDEGMAVGGEDKLEKAAKREQKDPLEIAEFYTDYYLRDEKKLNIKYPHFQPRPTQEIPEIIKMVEVLIRKGFAYETDDGVYFSVKKFSKYGHLSGNTLEKIKSGARVEVNENKKNPADFALWKKRVGANAKHTLHWSSPWGEGFPGWHIECSAMAIKYLGDTLDIHTGGEDNIFPHHECEIAQSEAFTEKPFVKYWIHTRHFYIEGKKMSKSLGNVYTVSKTPDSRFDSLEEKGYSALAFRMLKLSSHYRSKANFTWRSLDQAVKNWQKINELYKKLSDESNNAVSNGQEIKIKSYRAQFQKAMDDDLNTPKALSAILDLVKKSNQLLSKNKLSNISSVKSFLEEINQVFAILKPKNFEEKSLIKRKIIKLAEERQNARKDKDFKKADQIRIAIEQEGYKIIDEKDKYYIQKL